MKREERVAFASHFANLLRDLRDIERMSPSEFKEFIRQIEVEVAKGRLDVDRKDLHLTEGDDNCSSWSSTEWVK